MKYATSPIIGPQPASYRATVEDDVQMAVVADFHFAAQMGADTMHADWLCARHLAHQIDVVHAAIDDRRQRLHEVLVPIPGRAATLLVEIHAHGERLAQSAGNLDELVPRWVDAQDAADHQLALGFMRGADDLLGVRDADRDRLLHEDGAAGVHRSGHVFSMSVQVLIETATGFRLMRPTSAKPKIARYARACDRPMLPTPTTGT
jgi:hypothetical protein